MLINDIHPWLQWFHDVTDILLCNHCIIIIVFFHFTPVTKQIHHIAHYDFGVWLTVHRSSMWIKRPTRCHIVLYLFLLYRLLNMFLATLCPSSGADNLVVFFRCVAEPWLCRQQDLTAYTATALQHTWKIPISRQLLKNGTRWPETCWATYKGEINIILSDI